MSTTAAVMVTQSGKVTIDWDEVRIRAAEHLETSDPTASWCVALLAARSAALEEAADHLDWRQEATRMAGVKCKEIGSDDDAVRYAHYSQAHGAAAAAIRELKGK